MAACALGAGAQSGRTARKFTRNTLREWGLASLADDAEATIWLTFLPRPPLKSLTTTLDMERLGFAKWLVDNQHIGEGK